MACFLVPATEAVVTTVAQKVIKSKEKEKSVKIFLEDSSVLQATKSKFSTNNSTGSFNNSNSIYVYIDN